MRRRGALVAALLAIGGCGTRDRGGDGEAAPTEAERERDRAEASELWLAAMRGPQLESTLLRRVAQPDGTCRQLTTYRTTPLQLDAARARGLMRQGCSPAMAAAYSVMLRDLDGVEADLGRHLGGTCATPPPGVDDRLAPVRLALALGDRPRIDRALAALGGGAELRCRAGLIAAQLAEGDGRRDDARTGYAAIRGDGPCGLSARARAGAPAGPAVAVTGTLELPAGVTARVAFVAHPGLDGDPTGRLVAPARVSFWFGGERRDEVVAVVAAVDPAGRLTAILPPGTWMLEVELDRRDDPATKLTVVDGACWPLLVVGDAPVTLPPLRFALGAR